MTGKNDDKTPVFPAAYPDSNILSVAATNSKDKLASFSNFGRQDRRPRRARRQDRVHLLALRLRVHVGHQHGGAVRRRRRGDAAQAHSSWSVGDISSRLRKKGNALKSLKGKTVSGRRLNIDSALGWHQRDQAPREFDRGPETTRGAPEGASRCGCLPSPGALLNDERRLGRRLSIRLSSGR